MYNDLKHQADRILESIDPKDKDRIINVQHHMIEELFDLLMRYEDNAKSTSIMLMVSMAVNILVLILNIIR